MDPIFSKGVGDGATQDAWIWLQTLAFGAPLSSDQEVENCSLALACHDLQIDLIRAGFLVCSLPVKRRILEEVEFEAKVLRAGKNNAVASVDVRKKVSRQLAAQGRITMFFTGVSKL
eukprot:c20757_g2_i1 orf=296-646(-)